MGLNRQEGRLVARIRDKDFMIDSIYMNFLKKLNSKVLSHKKMYNYVW